MKSVGTVTLDAHMSSESWIEQGPLDELRVTALPIFLVSHISVEMARKSDLPDALPVNSAHEVLVTEETNAPAALRQPTSLPACLASTRT